MIMDKRKGFTLVETMIVVIIVAILGAVAIPILRARIDSAKWSEGRTMAATIATAIRTWAIGTTEVKQNWTPVELTAEKLGFAPGDLSGVYFKTSNFSWSVNNSKPKLIYVIKITKPDGIGSPGTQILNEAGDWSE